MLSDMGRRPMIRRNPDDSYGDDMDKDIGLMLKRRQEAGNIENELNLYRSGSAPPTVEGSLSAVGGLFGHGGGNNVFTGVLGNDKNISQYVPEDDVRSDPAYLSYYYSKVNLNPRLPPPLLSKEDWRSAQRLKGGGSALGGIGDRRKVNRPAEDGGAGGTRSLFAMPPGFNSHKEENDLEDENMGGSAEWGSDGLIGLSGIGLGNKQKSLADIFQNDLGRTTPIPSHLSRPSSRNAFEVNIENLGSAEAEIAHMRREMTYSDSLRSGTNVQGSAPINTIGPPTSYSYAAAVGASLSRSTTPDPQQISRAPSPAIAPVRGKNLNLDKRGVNSPGFSDPADMLAALSSMSLSANGALDEEKHLPPPQPPTKQYSYLNKSDSGHLHMPSPQSTKLSYSDLSNSNGVWLDHNSSSTSMYQHVDTLNSSYQNYGSGYANAMMASQLGNGTLPPLFENAAAASAMAVPGFASDSQNLNRLANHMNGNALQAPFVDPSYLQYLRTAEYAAAAAQVAALNDPTIDRNYYGNSYIDLVQKAYLGSLLSPQKSQYGASIGSKSSGSNHQGYYGNPPFGVGLSYPGSPLASPIIPNSPVGMRGHMGTWHLDAGLKVAESFSSSLLDEFKSNKSRCFELSEIVGHVVEFSADQYGSRFIQQKLETATTEEKNMVYEEIFPQALSLMTDVFGNYVIQKFFEHGMTNQRRELASKLHGHVLTLSLQMYGCRVIQKAIEVVDLDQKIEMVEELDGHVMRCVRDQNGNHVIQKCIECVPEEAIQFIVTTFFDQVVTLSTHPYGCRVIQRVLEHCTDPDTQSKVMDEVLGCVSMLAQDQYGNYVIQHVLEHGKPHERSIIIKELAGKIVQMSQQKFASNVVEKCLTFGGPVERQLLVVEMLGSTDENEPLQAMMKDQFANYVVQKVLETCEVQQRELILTRIKIHLNALKKYTYGKHIVARVEKLVAAGERRMAIQMPHLA